MTKKADEKTAEPAKAMDPAQEPMKAPEPKAEQVPAVEPETAPEELVPPRTITEEEIWEKAVLFNKVEPSTFDIAEMVERYKENELPALAAMVGRRVVGIQELQDGTMGLIMRNDLLADGDCTLWIKSEPLGGPGFAAITTTPNN